MAEDRRKTVRVDREQQKLRGRARAKSRRASWPVCSQFSGKPPENNKQRNDNIGFTSLQWNDPAAMWRM